jgi:hypothetical protein
MPEYIYGYGSTKHIPDSSRLDPARPWDGPGLCGAYGGYPEPRPNRPVCKRCLKRAEHNDGSQEAPHEEWHAVERRLIDMAHPAHLEEV